MDLNKLKKMSKKYSLPKELVRAIEKEISEKGKLKEEILEIGGILETIEHDTAIHFMIQKSFIDVSLNLLSKGEQDIEKIKEDIEKARGYLVKNKRSVIEHENLMSLATYRKIDFETIQKRAENYSMQNFIEKTVTSNFLDVTKREADVYLNQSLKKREFYTNITPLRNVIGNLTGNARKYSPENSKIRMRFSLEDNLLCFEIENRILESVLLNNEQLTQVFEKGHSNSQEEQGHGRNKGLGLYMVKNLVEKGYGGTIKVISDHKVRVTKEKLDSEIKFGNVEYDVGELENTPLFYAKVKIPESINRNKPKN